MPPAERLSGALCAVTDCLCYQSNCPAPASLQRYLGTLTGRSGAPWPGHTEVRTLL
jgi:hypothetical protein